MTLFYGRTQFEMSDTLASVRRYLNQYKRGIITDVELWYRITQEITETIRCRVHQLIAAGVAGGIVAYLRQCPVTAEDWSKVTVFRSWAGLSEEEKNAAHAEHVRVRRRGVEVLRDCIRPSYGPAEADFLPPGSISSLARSIYDDRAFDRLPILADALEEADCTDAILLSHLRGPGPHARCCWALRAMSQGDHR